MSDDSVLERVFRRIHNQLLDSCDNALAIEIGDAGSAATGEGDASAHAMHARKMTAGYAEVDSPVEELS